MRNTNSSSGVSSTRAIGAAIFVLLAIGLPLLWPSAASAEFVGDIVTIDVFNSNGQASLIWNPHLPHHALDRIQDALGWREFRGSGGGLLGSIDSLEIDFDGDPLIDMIFSATAGSAETTFTISSALLAFDALTDPIGEASATFELNDVVGSDPGALLAPVDPATGLFEALYNDGTLFSELVGKIEFNAPGATVSSSSAHGPVVISGDVNNIQGKVSFTLSANDSVSGHVRFEVVPIPEPTSLAMLALGAIGLLTCARRRWWP